ncbi:MAG: glycoside hydrolase family 15 protein [Myxococcales bacterium]|nr:glycoside hydrolase family 15 protein [Myxococcales bacterium]
MTSLLHILPFAVAAHASFTKLPSGNGFGTAVYDAALGKITGLREHVYQSVDTGIPTRDLLYDAYFGVRAGGKEGWLTGAPVDSAEYDGGVVVARQRFGGLTATQSYFTPFGVAAPSLVMVLELKNAGNAPIADVRAFTLHNLHLGEGDGTKGQRVDWQGGLGYVQRALGSQRVMLIRPITPPTRHTTTPRNPYEAVQKGEAFVDTDTSGDANDVASGFEYDFGTLAPGASVTVGVLLTYHPFGDTKALDAMTAGYLGGRAPAALVAAERKQWSDWLARARVPEGLTSDEQRLYRQQLVILRMAQSREPNDVANGYLPNGQIIASLRPGMWDITWVRDACLALAALSRAGYLDEARAGLEFMLRASAGTFQQYVGRPYRISVVRYLGKGKEESDSDQNGPNIEFDGFGLFLWATAEYLEGGGDRKFLDTWWSTLSVGIADVLVALVEPGGLLAADSSIWESHWENGGRQHYTYSDVWAVLGLERAARFAEGRDAGRAAKYRATAATLRGAIAARLVTGDHVLRPSTENQATVDAAVVEAFNYGVIDPTGPVAVATLDAFRKHLFLEKTGHGYKRNQNGGSYDEREWVVIDLRIATALRRAGRAEEADALWGWVRDQGLANHLLLAELYDQTTGDYAGEVPMVGFGAGAFVVTAWDRAAPLPAAPDGGAVDGGGDGGPGMGGGCDCALGGPSPTASGSLVITLVLLLGLRRRR